MTRLERDLVSGWLHEPSGEPLGRGLVITHGAGANCESPLLRSIAATFAEAGYHVLRCNLPFRQQRPHGPPFPATSARDREGLQRASDAIRELGLNYVILGGHSYGGRQATILAADVPEVADMLLLLSYPLHPPRKPEQLRTAHLPNLRIPALFVHGTRDPFGSIDEMQTALRLIPARRKLVDIEKKGHELSPDLAPLVLQEAQCFANG